MPDAAVLPMGSVLSLNLMFHLAFVPMTGLSSVIHNLSQPWPDYFTSNPAVSSASRMNVDTSNWRFSSTDWSAAKHNMALR